VAKTIVNNFTFSPTLEINSGSITAIGSPHGAGIGGNKNEDSGSIIINGGFVNAVGHYGAGIGGGEYANGGWTHPR